MRYSNQQPLTSDLNLMKYDWLIHYSLFSPATSPDDYISESVNLEFPLLSVTGTSMCIDIVIIEDILTEGTESFDLNLALDINSEGLGVSLGNDKTFVSINGG